jgi:hypothetical protein
MHARVQEARGTTGEHERARVTRRVGGSQAALARGGWRA